MQHFSREYADKLIAEHKLVSATITHLTSKGAGMVKSQQHGQDAYAQAINNLRARKVELEGFIDVLTDYLDG